MVTAIHSMEESMMKAKNNGSFNLTSRDQPAVINMSFLSIQSTLSKTDTFGTGTSCLSVLERCPSYRESNKGSKERQGPSYRGVR